MPVKHQVTTPENSRDEFMTQGQFVRVGPAQKIRDALLHTLERKGNRMMMHEQRARAALGRRIEGQGHFVNLLAGQKTVTRKVGAIVRPRAVDTYKVEPRQSLHLHSLAHEVLPDVFADPVVISRHDGHAPRAQQRRKGLREKLKLSGASLLGDVTCHDDVVHFVLQKLSDKTLSDSLVVV